MSAAATILVGAVLTFGTSDGTQLSLTVSLAESATVTLDWNGITKTSSVSDVKHTFEKLPTPRLSPAKYRLLGPGGVLLERTVKPLVPGGPLSIALYGDSRDGPGPHKVLAKSIAEVAPNILVHTGDVIHKAGDAKGWIDHLTSAMPATSAAPLIYALGNHELWQDWRKPKDQRIDAYAAAMSELPPPEDPIAKEVGVHRGVYHVRIGRTLFIALDSNRPIDPGQPQGRFLERVLKDHADATWKFIALHHGPLSSGRHGPSAASPYLMYQAQQNGVTAFFAGHDHLYERIVQGGVTVLVSGGGGAPLYQRWRFTEGSQAFVSTYNWVRVDLASKTGTVTAYGLEGTVLDRGRLPAAAEKRALRKDALVPALSGAALVLAGLGFVLFRLVMRPR